MSTSARAAGAASAAATPHAARVERVLRAADELERRLPRPAPVRGRVVVATRGGRAFLPRGERVLLGRGARCDVVLAGAHVSREHAVLLWHGGAWWVEDLDSSNGTFVEGERVLMRRLRDGDVLVLGDEPVRVTLH